MCVRQITLFAIWCTELVASLENSLLMLETFDGTPDILAKSWTNLTNEKYTGVWSIDERESLKGPKNYGIRMSTASRHHGYARKLNRLFDPKIDKELYGTIEVRNQDKITCGGAYFKLFKAVDDVSGFTNETPYSIMFGPDKCGATTDKVHLIIKHLHPKSNKETYVEEHLIAPSLKTSDREGPRQYGFAQNSTHGGCYEIYIDGIKVMSGRLKDNFTNGFRGKKTVVDKDDTKPADWVDDEMMPDPDSVKPDDWEENEFIVDPNETKPEGWLDDEPKLISDPTAEKPTDADDNWRAPLIDNPRCVEVGCGEWTPTKIKNPNYKGTWSPSLIKNPKYIGPWSPRIIDNPEYYDIENPFEVLQPFDAIGIEVWTVEPDVVIDNIMLTTNREEFERFIHDTFTVERELEAARKAAADTKETKEEIEGYRIMSKVKHLLGSLIRAIVSVKSESTVGTLMTFGIVIATSGYIVNRMVRRGTKPAVVQQQQPSEKAVTEESSDKSKSVGAEEKSGTTEEQSVEGKKSGRKRTGSNPPPLKKTI